MPRLENTEKPIDSVIQPYKTEQQVRTNAIRLRRSRQAKFFFGCSVALLSSYVTIQVQHYIGGREVSPMSILFVLGMLVAIRSTWRAT